MVLYVTADAAALSAAECLLQRFGRLSEPHQLRSDDGPHFIADVIKQFLFLISIEQSLILAYFQEENTVVERFNKKINRHLCALTSESLSLGDHRKFLSFVQRILNSNRTDRLKMYSSKDYLGTC